MAQEVKIAGATYSDVPSISVPDSNGTYHSFVDTSDADATVNEIVAGFTAYVNGVKLTGIGSSGGMSFSKVNSLPSSPDSTTFYLIGDSSWSATGDIALEDIVFTSALPSTPDSNTIYVLV